MIQDIYPHIMHNEFQRKSPPDQDSLVIHFRDDRILARGEMFPKLSEFSDVRTDRLIYLFTIDEENHYYLLDDPDFDTLGQLPAGYEYLGIRSLRRQGFSKKYRAFAAFTAFQLSNWYRNNRFCGRCGQKTYLGSDERVIRCNCGNVIYPRIVPAVIVGVTNGDKLLVTKYRIGYDHYALVAGFTEIGETLEETVSREVMEEAGLKVKNIRYYKSQPWGIVDDLLAGFYCDVDGDDTIVMDRQELKVAEWRGREEIELQPDDYSLTNEMMKRFKEGAEL